MSNINRSLVEKVEGVDLPFREQDWAAMQGMLDAQGASRAAMWWKRASWLVLLLGVGASVAYGLWPSGDTYPPAVAQVAFSEADATIESDPAPVLVVDAANADATNTVTSTAVTISANGSNYSPTNSNARNSGGSSDQSAIPVGTNAEQVAPPSLESEAFLANNEALRTEMQQATEDAEQLAHPKLADLAEIAATGDYSSVEFGPINDHVSSGRERQRAEALPELTENGTTDAEDLDNETAVASELANTETSDGSISAYEEMVANGLTPPKRKYDNGLNEELLGHPGIGTAIYFNFWNNAGYTGFEQKHSMHSQFGTIVTSEEFTNRSFLAAYDGSFGEHKKFGAGIFYRQTNVANRTEALAAVSLSYQIDVSDHHFRLGASAGQLTHTLDWDEVTFGDAIHTQNGFVGTTYETQNQGKARAMTLSTGLFYNYKKLYVGLAAEDLNQPNMSLTDGESRISTTYRVNGGYRVILVKKLHLIPSLNVQLSDNITRYSPALLAEMDQKYLVGASYQNLNTFKLNVGMNVKERFRIILATGIPNKAVVRGLNATPSIEGGVRYQFGKTAAPNVLENE
jgi:type IX secretion system PorP/SprF family membrane protein